MSHKLSLDDMFRQFPHFSHMRKMAIAFAVYAEMDIDGVINLKWSDEMVLNWRAELILSKVQFSNSIGLVFFEYNDSSNGDNNNNKVKLLSLPFLVDASTSWSNWALFSNQYRNATPIEFSRVYLSI